MIIFEKWWHKGCKVVCVSYYKSWKKPEFKIFTNGAKRKNGDNYYDFNIHFGRFAFWYTNYDLQRETKKFKTRKVKFVWNKKLEGKKGYVITLTS